MALRLRPLHDVFVAEASGLDLRSPLSDAQLRTINAAMNEHAVLVWRDMPLTQDEQVAFASQFGPLDVGLRRATGRPQRLQRTELIDISNVALDGTVADRESPRILSNIANMLWHSDSSFMNPRAAYSMLSCVTVPSWGGNTEFADLRAAYDRLPERLRAEVETLSAQHFALHTRQLLGAEAFTDNQKTAIPPADWPLVQTHAGSGRKLLFVGVHATHVIGWPVAEGRMLLSDLLEHATQRELVYSHAWTPGDFVMWDNRCTLHRGRRYDLSERRELRRSTINDTTEAMLAAD